MAFINMIQIQRVGLLAAIVVMVSFACPSFTYAAQVTLVVNNGSNSGLYNENEAVIVEAGPAPEGKEFDKWIGDTFVLVDPKQANTTATIALPLPGKMTVVQDFESTGGAIGKNLDDGPQPKKRWGKAQWKLQNAEGTGNEGSLVADNRNSRGFGAAGNIKYQFSIDGFVNPFDGTQPTIVIATKIIAVTAGEGALGLRVEIQLAPNEQFPPTFGIQSIDGGPVRLILSPHRELDIPEFLTSSETLTLGQWYDLEMRVTTPNGDWSQATGSVFFRLTGTTDWTAASGLQDIALVYDQEELPDNPTQANFFRIIGQANKGHAQIDDLAFGTPLVATNPTLTITATYKDEGVISSGELIPPNQLLVTSFTDETNGAVGGRFIAPAFNGTGLLGDTHNTATKSMWLSPGFAITNSDGKGKWIKIDLGGTFNLDHLQVWNYNKASGESLGIKQADIYVALTDPIETVTNVFKKNTNNSKRPFNTSGWTLAVSNQQFTESPGGAIQPTDQNINLGGVEAAYLAINIDSNFTTDTDQPDNRVGLSEMNIFSREVTSTAPHKLTVINGSGGSFFTPGTFAPIIADDRAGEDLKFDRWTGDGIVFVDPTLRETNVIMPATAATVTATYKSSLLFNLTVINGSNDGNGPYGADEIVDIVADAAPLGQKFLQWTGATVADPFLASTTVTMPEAHVTVTANYGADNDSGLFLLTVTNGTGGGLRAENETIEIVANDAPDGQQFDQWTGDIASVTDPFAATTQITMPASAATITATYKSAGPRFTWDVDGDGNVKVSTDGLLNLRHQFGFTGAALINNIAIDSEATRKTAAEIAAYLTAAKGLVASDIDGNGEIDALTDGVLLMRYLDGSRNDSLITDAVGEFATRSTATDIQDFIQASMP